MLFKVRRGQFVLKDRKATTFLCGKRFTSGYFHLILLCGINAINREIQPTGDEMSLKSACGLSFFLHMSVSLFNKRRVNYLPCMSLHSTGDTTKIRL